MPPAMLILQHLLRTKRQLVRNNVGGHENNPQITGTNNKVTFNTNSSDKEETTLLRKAGSQVGKILEGGTDIVVSPAKWLAHVQENWLTYIVCATILMIGTMIIYYYIRRKTTFSTFHSFAKPNLSAMVMDEALKLASYRGGIQDY